MAFLVLAGMLLLPGTGAKFTGTTTNDASFRARSNLALGGLYRFGYNSTPALTPAQVGTSNGWTQVSSGSVHSCGLRSSGQLWCWGSPTRGELGLGTTDDRIYAPARIGTATWTYIAAGRGLTCGVQTAGTLWCWGRNDFYQLGQGDQVLRPSPTQVGTATDWKTVSQSDRSVCALRTTGALWCWGSNIYGQAGQGTTSTYVTTPLQVGSDTDWVDMDFHYYHGCARKTDNSLWCWGSDSNGQQGRGTSGTGLLAPAKVGANSDWSRIRAGFDYSCGIRASGQLFCMGRGAGGRLAQGANTSDQSSPVRVGTDSNWAEVDVNENQGCAVKTTGTLFCWGVGGTGLLGTGDLNDRTTPTQVGTDTNWSTVSAGVKHGCGLRSDGTVWCWGNSYEGQVGQANIAPAQLAAGSRWQRLAPDRNNLCAVSNSGQTWCKDDNGAGQLGQGDTTARAALTQVASSSVSPWSVLTASQNHVCGVRAEGTLWCWGANAQGELGLGNTTQRTSATKVGSDTTWVDASSGVQMTCGIRALGTLWCWGLNSSGQLGLGNTTSPQSAPVRVGSETTWKQVSSRFASSCAVRTDGSLWCWGANDSGQLGLGNKTVQTSPQRVGTDADWSEVATGGTHSCALKNNGGLWCWGAGANGQLGLGDTSERLTPVRVGTGTTWSNLSAGLAHTCAAQTDLSLWCWGFNGSGQLGLGDVADRTSPTRVSGVTTSLVAATFFGTYVTERS